MDLKRLREATRPEHEATESAVPLMKADLTLEEYLQVLQRFAVIVGAWDAFAAKAAPAAYAPLVAQRRRSVSLQHDLAHFGADAPGEASTGIEAEIATVVGDSATAPYRFLGAMYVLEGSTLGGRFIAEHVESSLGLSPGQGDDFFRGYGAQTIPMWREFQTALSAVPEQDGDAVIAAATQMFAVFQKHLLVDADRAQTPADAAKLASY